MNRIVLVLFSLFLISCGSSVEKQDALWKSKKSLIDQYSQKYLFLSDTISKQYAIASEAMERANQIVDEEQRISAMKSANNQATLGPLSIVMELEQSIESLSQDINDVKNSFKPDEFSQKTIFLLTESSRCLEGARAAIGAKYSSVDSALAILNLEGDKVKEVERTLENHYKEVVNNRPEKEEATAAPQLEKATDKSTQAQPVATVKCKKCGSVVDAAATSCKNCGAPVKK